MEGAASSRAPAGPLSIWLQLHKAEYPRPDRTPRPRQVPEPATVSGSGHHFSEGGWWEKAILLELQ